MNTAPKIEVERNVDGDAVRMTTRNLRSINAYLFSGETFILAAGGGPSITTTDLRRLADTIDAVHAGTYQVTPELPTGRK